MFNSKSSYEPVSFSTGVNQARSPIHFAFARFTQNCDIKRDAQVMACLFGSAVVWLAGCNNANPNTGTPPPQGITRLTPITFSPASGFAQGADPAEFSIGAGSITASGGTAGTRGEFGLYADDMFAWDFLAGSEGMITFNNLDVVAIDGYWVHPNRQTAGATMTVMFSGGGTFPVASAPVNATSLSPQPLGFFTTVTAPDGESITSLAFTFDDGAVDGDVAALDVLELGTRK